MSQRNPMNERYTGDHKGGSTRKSAASAKPVTKAASSVRMASDKPEKKGLFAKRTPEEKQEHKQERKQETKESKEERKTGRARLRAIQRYVPDTPQFKALNRKRIIFSAIGLCGMVIAIILSLIIPTMQMIPLTVMIVSWVFFFFSIRIDSKQLRPMRQEAYEREERKMMKKAKK